MDVVLLSFDGCPNWQTTADRLRQALALAGHTAVQIHYRRVDTEDDATRSGFIGSPTVLIDGRDRFTAPGGATGLACRAYRTPAGLAGSPTVAQLADGVRQASAGGNSPKDANTDHLRRGRELAGVPDRQVPPA